MSVAPEGEDAETAAVATAEDWHSRTAGDVLAAVGSAPGGLPADEALRRLARDGPNALPAAAGRHPLLRLLAQFNNALIYFLLAAALAAFVLGHAVDAAVIVVVVLVNAIVGFVQEGKAEKALDAIRSMISPHASVLRDGIRTSVRAVDLVTGDVVILEPGDRVPADLRLVRARGLLIDEALLTGESVAAEKDTAPVAADAALGDRRSLAFSGTLVAAGQGSGVVVATGPRTQIGRISALLQSVEDLTTPLLRQINTFGRRFTWTAMIGAALIFAFATLVRDYAWVDALIAVVALAVGAVPEGLPAVITITLAIGVQRMAARNAIIRRLPAVETLGATSVICSDKTGTLTHNEMTARRIVSAGHEVEATGSGYLPEGELIAKGAADDAECLAAIAPLVRCALVCNDAHLRVSAGSATVEGDPMEGALVALAMKTGIAPEHERAEWPRQDEVPFDAVHRFMATLNRGPGGEKVIFVKGAPERLLQMSAAQAGLRADEPLDHEYWGARIAAAASGGERVLGFAMKPADTYESIAIADVEEGLVFLGIIGLIDPPRAEALDAIAQCHSAGIAVKMITGDHGTTAAAIARELKLSEEPEALTGAQLDDVADEALPALVRRAAVFARTSPEHKLRIVRALQSHGAVVAMTGDGVNDAPSLKQADIGIAMGRKGTEAAKEAAEMVLLDDNFASIVAAVHEGRTVYDNIRKVISWTLPTNGGEVLTVVAAIAFGFALPMTAAQILWVNLVTSATLGLVLAFEPSEPGVMARAPRPASEPLLSPFLLWRVVMVSVLFMAIGLSMYFYALGRGADLETARTIVVNTIVVLEIFYLFNVRYLHMTSITLRGVVGTRAVLVAIAVVVAAQLAFTYAPVMQTLFQTRPVAFGDGVLIVGCGLALLILLEIEKLVLRRVGVFSELAA